MRYLYTILIALLLVASSTHVRAASKPTEQEELALAAMEGLMAQPAERALPIIKKVLAGLADDARSSSARLFVLSQIDSPEADEILLQTSRSSDAALRKEAIRSIGIGGHEKSLAALQDIYRAGDADVKEQVLHAWLIAERKQQVYQAALDAKSEEEAGEAIHMLSVMGAVEELRKLGERPNASKRAGGRVCDQRRSAEPAQDRRGQRRARSSAPKRFARSASSSTDASRSALREIYSRSTDAEIKKAALEGMLIAGDEQGVLALYRAATTAEEKRALLRTLTMMDGDAALEAIDAALEGKK